MKLLTVFLIGLLTATLYAQEADNHYIIDIEGNKIYTDFKKGEIEKGNMLKVSIDAGYFIHPLTGDTIIKENESIMLQVIELADQYSIALLSDKNVKDKIRKGMVVKVVQGADLSNKSFKRNVAIGKITMTGNIYGAYLNNYVSELIKMELFNTTKVNIIEFDQSTIFDVTKLKELKLEYNIDYLIIGTSSIPDVVVQSSQTRLRDILEISELLSKKDLNSGLFPNIEKQWLTSAVELNIKIIGTETGDILFMKSYDGSANGQNSIYYEGGVLNGMELNNGMTDFVNTVTGQAYKKVAYDVALDVNKFFEAKTGFFTDIRDGQSYQYITIGKTKWMIENLNYKPEYGSICAVDQLNDCNKCGRLYNWQTAQNVCPNGWEMPSRDDWLIIYRYMQKRELDFEKFNLEICGYCNEKGNIKYSRAGRIIAEGTFFWSRDEKSDKKAYSYNVQYKTDIILGTYPEYFINGQDKLEYNSCRCIQKQ